MTMNEAVDYRTKQVKVARLILIIALVASIYATAQLLTPAAQSGLLFASRRWMLVGATLSAGILLQALFLFLIWTPTWPRIMRAFETLQRRLEDLRWLNLIFFFFCAAGLAFLVVGPLGEFYENLPLRLVTYGLAVLVGSLFLQAYQSWMRRSLRPGDLPISETRWANALLLLTSLIFMAFVYRLLAFIPDISTHPFALNWSETSRFYYASLYFSEAIYGIRVPPTVLHPSRYLLQSIPFLLTNSPLWLHRLWQVLLWIGITFSSSFLLARRLGIGDSLKRWLLIAWTFLFLLLGPVYYHLQVVFLLVLWGFDSRIALFTGADGRDGREHVVRFWKSFIVVILASAWAGISRINWFPVPGLLAATLYFLEQPVNGRSFWRYLLPPGLWTLVGVAIAFGAQAWYVMWSGNAAGEFTSSFTSDLLWYRLFPNPTDPLGILPATLLVSAPMMYLIFDKLHGRWYSYHWLRYLGLAGILLVFLVGGLVVSVKIGGGSNLHNLDAYLCILLVVSACFYFDAAIPESDKAGEGRPINAPNLVSEHGAPPCRFAISCSLSAATQVVLALVILIPVYYALTEGRPIPVYNSEDTAKTLDALRSIVQETVAQGGEVLFISERQLLTFHNLDSADGDHLADEGHPAEIRLVPEYERVFLMEMAMAGNPSYLGKFHADIRQQRFALIVSEPLYIQYKGRLESFGEENDAWVSQVSKYILCYYEAKKTLRQAHIKLYVPNPNTQGCP